MSSLVEASGSQSAPIQYSTEEYGALCNNVPDYNEEDRYYITTAIAYTNGYPHIGHAYEFLTTDVLARYHRALGKNTFFLTGTDEHGQKVAASAEKANLTPIEHCDKYVAAFKELNKRLLITYSDFMRTTNPYHEQTSQDLWTKCAANDDIYLDAYEGWYNEREEVFVSNTEAEAAGFKDIGSGLPLKLVKEESYFFRMSKYCERLIAYIEENPSFIEPEQYRSNIMGRLRKEGLKDLSISRTSFTWGIPVPREFNSKHVMYVWFDALTNYLSGVHALDSEHPLSKFWPASVHIIGKDIVWFHCVIWPCMLFSAGLPLPRQVYSHGFVNASDGRKMSKSYNNTVDPNELLAKYPVDSVRYYCIASITYGADINFSEAALIAMHNSELADILGNLSHRVLNLTQKYCAGHVPDTLHDAAFNRPFDLAALKASVSAELASCSLHAALFQSMEAVRATNKFLTESEPWKLKGDDQATVTRRQSIVRTALEALFACAHFLAPVIPRAAQHIFSHLHSSPRALSALRDDFYNLQPGTLVTVGEILFQKIEDPASVVPASAPGNSTANASANSNAKAGSSKDKKEESNGDSVEHPVDFTKLDIRVGLIRSVAPHPTAERLFVEQIELGELGERSVVSGLRQHYSIEELQGRKVLVLCNLKESKFQGVMSYGMVLGAFRSSDETDAGGKEVELLAVPEHVAVGQRVLLRGYESYGAAGKAFSVDKVKRCKVWESVAPLLKTNATGAFTFNDIEVTTAEGESITATLVNSAVH